MSEDGPDDGEDPDPDPDHDPETPEAPDGQPEIKEDERADLDGIDVDPDDLDPAPEDGGDGGDEDGSADTDTEGSPEPDSDAPGATGEWGDMYVETLAATTSAIIDEHGDGHDVDAGHFRQISLDQHFSDLMQKFGDGAEMEPEKAVIVGTAIGVAGPVALHTDLLSEAFGGESPL